MSETEKALSSFHWLESQRLVFVGCFLVGAIGIIAIRLLTDSVLFAIMFSAASMFAYVIFGASKKYVIRPDVIGDNSYYLGFLFTLVSLAFTLYKFSNDQDIDTIIQNFGLALSSTLIGLVLRVYFNQTNEDTEVYQQAIRLSLAQEAANLIGETAKIRDDVSVLRLSIHQKVEEGIGAAFQAFNENLKASSEAYFDQIQKRSDELSNSLETLISGLTDSVSVLDQNVRLSSQAFTDAVGQFNGTTGVLIEEMRSLVAKIRNIKSLDEVIAQKINAPLDQVSTSLAEFERGISSADGKISAITDGAGRFVAVLDRVGSEGLNGLIGKFVELDRSVVELVNKNRELVEITSSVQGALRDTAAKFPQELDKLENVFGASCRRLEDAATSSQSSFIALQESLVSIAQTITENVKRNA